jgi:hypothetical protein
MGWRECAELAVPKASLSSEIINDNHYPPQEPAGPITFVRAKVIKTLEQSRRSLCHTSLSHTQKQLALIFARLWFMKVFTNSNAKPHAL